MNGPANGRVAQETESLVLFETPKCSVCGNRSAWFLDRVQFERWKTGTLIQHAFPDMAPEQREELITGIHADCFREMFGSEEDEEDEDA